MTDNEIHDVAADATHLLDALKDLDITSRSARHVIAACPLSSPRTPAR